MVTFHNQETFIINDTKTLSLDNHCKQIKHVDCKQITEVDENIAAFEKL